MNTNSPRPADRVRRRLLAWMLPCLLGLPAALQAEVPEPDNVIFGVITLGNTPVTSARTDVVVEARKTTNGPVIARYRMGENRRYANAYSLEIPLEAFNPLSSSNSTRAGALVHLSVRDASGVRDSRSVAIAQRGQLVRVDFTETDTDEDGLPDRWEALYFAGTTAGGAGTDTDGDGRSNLQEFIEGTNPLVPDGRHPADNAPADDVVTLEEADAYAAAWQAGERWATGPTNIPVAYVSRAAALALAGTRYAFTNSPATNAPMNWVNLPYAGPRPPGASLATSLPVPPNPPAGVPFTVTLVIAPTNTVSAFAVQDHPPTGWTNVLNISHGGSFDPASGLVKWGPFPDNSRRELTYDLVRPTNATGGTFAGIASFDGYNLAITGARSLQSTGGVQIAPLVWNVPAPDELGPSFQLSGTPLTAYIIEFSTNLVDWAPLETNALPASGRQSLRPPNVSEWRQLYLRARRAP